MVYGYKCVGVISYIMDCYKIDTVKIFVYIYISNLPNLARNITCPKCILFMGYVAQTGPRQDVRNAKLTTSVVHEIAVPIVHIL